MALKMRVKVRFGKAGFSGLGGQGANTMFFNILRREEAVGKATIIRAGKFCRGVVRRSMRAGSTKFARLKKRPRKGGRKPRSADGLIRAQKKRIRTRSTAGVAPRNHRGNAWGLKWIRATNAPDFKSVKIGPEVGVPKSPHRSKFHVDEMMERGGTGQIMAPQDLPEGEAGYHMWKHHSTSGAKWPEVFVTARYPKREYLRPAAKITANKILGIYVNERKSKL